MGHKTNIGKKAKALIITTPDKTTIKRRFVVGKHLTAGRIFFCAKEPARIKAETIRIKRPANIANAVVKLKKGVLKFNPPSEEPLFPIPDAYA